MALLQLRKTCTQLAKGSEPIRCGTLQAASASARAVLHHPHPARYVGALSLCVARTRDLEEEAAGGTEPRAGQNEEDLRNASNSLCFGTQEIQHLGLGTTCPSNNCARGCSASDQ